MVNWKINRNNDDTWSIIIDDDHDPVTFDCDDITPFAESVYMVASIMRDEKDNG